MNTFIRLATTLSLILSYLSFFFTTADGKVANPDIRDDLPLIQFSQAGYQVNEEDNTVEVTLTLSASSDITVSVNITSTGITAAIGDDFIPIFTQFELLPGQTALQFSVDIMDDWQGEPDETFLLALSEPIGALLGPQTTTIVTILDNDGFVDAGIQLTGSPSSWVDYDEDGDLDLLTTSAILYENNGQGIFTQASTNLPTTPISFSDWADYDNDGDMDLFSYSTSTHIVLIYRNDGGGNFSNSGATFPSMYFERADWGDFDNDGDLDLLILGDSSVTGPSFTKIYRNDGSAIFVDIGLSLEPIGYGDCAWADFDNDGDLDFALTGNRMIGHTLTDGVTFLYRNNGNSTFTKLSTSFTGLSGGSISWGDYDRDGDLDFLVDGCSASYSPCPFLTKLYKNNNGTFADAGAGLPGAGGSHGDLDWGDYDNDGDLDILLTGIVDQTPIARVYRNDGGIFSDIATGLNGNLESKAGWADYDNDGDLDIVTGFTGPISRIYKNKIHQPNTIPGIPTGLSVTVEESAVTLHWLATTDPETPSGSLSYGIWVGIYPGGRNVSSPMSNGQTGYRQVPEMGTVELGTSARLVHLQPNRDYYWRVQSVDSAFAGSPFSAQGTFTTLPASIHFSQGSQNITESNSLVPIGISLSTPSYQTVNVDYFAENINAQPGYDYQPISGTVTLNPGQTYTTVMLPVFDDNFRELNETFRLNLSNPQNAILGDPPSTLITIVDNDTTYGVCFSQPEYTASEMQTSLVMTTTLCGVSATVPITVSLNIVGGTATQGVDYQPADQTIVFVPGQYSQTVNTILIDDPMPEGDETILYQLSNPVHAVIGNPGSATGIIHDDDNPSDVSFAAPEYTAQEAEGYLPVTVTLSTAEPYEIRVNVNDASQTAQAGQDYGPINQVVIFPPGETQQVISVTLIDDALDEVDETFLLQLSNPENARLGALTETEITILDNDPIPAVQFYADAISLGESNGYAAITVTLSTPSEKTISINYATITGTASADDFIQASGIITFSPGITNQMIYVSPVNDSTDEDNENFSMNLTDPVNSSLGIPSTILVTIIDDDDPPSIQFFQPAYQAGEGQGSAPVLIAISHDSELPVSVNFDITGGSASPLDDFSVIGGPIITLNPGEVTYTVWIDLFDDLLTEGDETIQFALSNPINSFLGSPITATFTIVDNDMPPTAVDDIYTGTEDFPLSVDAAAGLLANDYDPDSANLMASLVSGPDHGVLTLRLDGSFIYTPTLNYSGDDTFVYAVSDGLSEDTALVTLNINPANDQPLANDDEYVTDEDTPLGVPAEAGVLINDVDVEGDELTAVLVTETSFGALNLVDDGSFSYTPDANFNGIDIFTYFATDGITQSHIATVTLNITSITDLPDAVNDTASLPEDNQAVIYVLGNDNDPDGDPLSIVNTTQPSHGQAEIQGDHILYTPNSDTNGSDSFSYTISDSNQGTDTATVSLTISPVNDAPGAVDDEAGTTERTPVAIYVLGNDIDVDGDVLTIVNVTDPLNGEFIYSNGVITYTPSMHFIGVDEFNYTISDGELTDTATVVVTVDSGDAPVAVDDAYTVIEDTTLVVPAETGLLANDIDPRGLGLTAHLISNPLNGTLELNEDGSFTYIPNPGFRGNDHFTYRVFDGVVYSLVVDVVITVNAPGSAFKVYVPIIIR